MGGKAVAVEALKRGAQDYLVKGTFSPEVLRRVVGDAIERVAIREEVAMPEDPSSEVEDPRRGDSLRVLIVDDNVQAAESLALVVKLWNHDTKVAYDGPEAIGAAEAYKPQVVLLDIGLPGMDGYSVASNLRSRPELQDVTMIAMTGYGRDEDFQRSKAVGFDRHLVKPIDFTELQSLLDEVVSRGLAG